MRTPATVTQDFRRTTLHATHRVVVRAMAEAMFFPDGDGADGQEPRLDAFVDEVDAFLSPASKTLRFGLRVMLIAIRWSPLLYLRLAPFESLDRTARAEHLERLERSRWSRLPLLVVAYKTVLTLLFYEDEKEERAIGYPGAARKRWLMRASGGPP